jgi:phosphatidylserine/phosphatidylglycerophosphate/cardiolipin synthase-like enzyme
MNTKASLFFSIFLLAFVGCSTPPSRSVDASSRVPSSSSAALDKLPIVKSFPIGNSLSKQPQLKPVAEAVDRYLEFLGVDPNSEMGQEIISRLAMSSLQFLVCDSFEDWSCLEQTPVVKPNELFRVDAADDLGKRVDLPGKLKIEAYFTEQWDVKNEQRDLNKALAGVLARKISDPSWNAVSMASYGIDDRAESMKEVYESIVDAQRRGVSVRAVFDTEGLYPNIPKPVVFTSIAGRKGLSLNGKPLVNTFERNPDAKDRNGKPEVADYLNFYYGDTGLLAKTLNSKAKRESQTVARLEWPPEGAIMHNKFFVFEGSHGDAVWTGTANISRTCMGDESNANMAVFIDDDVVAKVFKDEFDEMFDFAPKPFSHKSFAGVNDDGKATPEIRAGRFKQNKRPNTRRYFQYADGTELRIHFSPTDDGEHRSILPFLYSAREGDELRISMFGSSGIEYIRAIQWAVAKGVDVKVLIDRNSGLSAKGSWIHKDSPAKLIEANPFAKKPRGSLAVRYSGWAGGMNHHKTASLTRKSGVAEVLIVGSQNWSVPGNDSNDENMLTIRNRQSGVKAAEVFNQHFDSRLWKKGKDVPVDSN